MPYEMILSETRGQVGLITTQPSESDERVEQSTIARAYGCAGGIR